MAHVAYQIVFVSPATGAGGFTILQGNDKAATWPDDATALLCQQMLEYDAGWQTELRMLTSYDAGGGA